MNRLTMTRSSMTRCACLLTPAALVSLSFPASISSLPDDPVRPALQLHEDASTIAQELEALELFRRACDKRPEEWLPSYWTAYMCTQVARAKGRAADFPDDVHPEDLIGEALERLAHVEGFVEDMSPAERSDLHVLRGFLCDFEGLLAIESEEVLQARQEQEYKAALRLNPRNANMQVITAIALIQWAQDFRMLLGAQVLLDGAEEIYAEAKQRSRTTHFAQDFLGFWRNRADEKMKGRLR